MHVNYAGRRRRHARQAATDMLTTWTSSVELLACLFLTAACTLPGAAAAGTNQDPINDPAAQFDNILRAFAPEMACRRILDLSNTADSLIRDRFLPGAPRPAWPWNSGADNGTSICLPNTMLLPKPAAYKTPAASDPHTGDGILMSSGGSGGSGPPISLTVGSEKRLPGGMVSGRTCQPFRWASGPSQRGPLISLPISDALR